jgi:hypothetical protein
MFIAVFNVLVNASVIGLPQRQNHTPEGRLRLQRFGQCSRSLSSLRCAPRKEPSKEGTKGRSNKEERTLSFGKRISVTHSFAQAWTSATKGAG